MADVTTRPLSFARRLQETLTRGLATAGIKAKVKTEPVRTTRLHRVLVTAKKFDELAPSERQNLVWRIIGQNFSPEEQLLISMVLTLTPDELKGN
jgi:hypothetical protein